MSSSQQSPELAPFLRLSEITDFQLRLRLEKFDLKAVSVINSTQKLYNYRQLPIEFRYSETLGVLYADGALMFGSQVRINLAAGLLTEVQRCCRKISDRIVEKEWKVPVFKEEFWADMAGLWAVLHEYSHVMRNHTDSENPAITEAGRAVGSESYIRATEIDADLIATISLWRFFRSRAKAYDDIYIAQKLVVAAITPFFCLLHSSEAGRGSGRYDRALKRLFLCACKLVLSEARKQDGSGAIVYDRRIAEKYMDVLTPFCCAYIQAYSEANGLGATVLNAFQEECRSSNGTMDRWISVAPIILPQYRHPGVRPYHRLST